MTILGFQFDILLVLQIGVTVTVITLFALFTSLQESEANRISDAQMLLLTSFVIDNHPEYDDLSKVTEAKQPHLDDELTKVHWFAPRFTEFRVSGSLPSVEDYEGTNLRTDLLMMFLAPVFGILIPLFDIIEDRHYRVQRIEHTANRKNTFSKYAVTISSGLVYLTVGLLAFQVYPTIGYIGAITGSLAILGSIVGLSMQVRGQIVWKGFWQDRLLDILAKAEKERDHDLFNRAMIMKNNIESQPDTPLPGRLGFYTVVYSAIQGLLLFFANLLGPST